MLDNLCILEKDEPSREEITKKWRKYMVVGYIREQVASLLRERVQVSSLITEKYNIQLQETHLKHKGICMHQMQQHISPAK